MQENIAQNISRNLQKINKKLIFAAHHTFHNEFLLCDYTFYNEFLLQHYTFYNEKCSFPSTPLFFVKKQKNQQSPPGTSLTL